MPLCHFEDSKISKENPPYRGSEEFYARLRDFTDKFVSLTVYLSQDYVDIIPGAYLTKLGVTV